jgi:transcriptional regulator SbtR-like protein
MGRLRHIAQHCAAEKALTVLMRTSGADEAAQNRSVALLGGAGQRLLDRAAAAGAVRRGVTIEEMLLSVNAAAEVCSDNDVDIDRVAISPGTGCGQPPTRFDLRG